MFDISKSVARSSTIIAITISFWTLNKKKRDVYYPIVNKTYSVHLFKAKLCLSLIFSKILSKHCNIYNDNMWTAPNLSIMIICEPHDHTNYYPNYQSLTFLPPLPPPPGYQSSQLLPVPPAPGWGHQRWLGGDQPAQHPVHTWTCRRTSTLGVFHS